MDPSLTRKPLPSSTSIAVLQHPTTLIQWTSALQRVKALYLRGLLKQCSDRCNLLLSKGKKLPHPLHATYLHFYSALSTEGTARLIHNLSTLKLPTLKNAKTSYEAAAFSLPVAEYVADDDITHTSDTLSERSVSTFGASRNNFTPSPSRPSSPICSSSPSSVDSHYSIDDYEEVKKPPPLRINKTESHSSKPVGDTSEPSTPASRAILSSPILITRPPPINFSASASSWLKSRANDRYNAHLASFAEMLTSHIEAINGLIRTAEDIQNNRYTARRPLNYSAESRAEDLRIRIVKLRERGWRRERFAPERYMDLCKKALDELEI